MSNKVVVVLLTVLAFSKLTGQEELGYQVPKKELLDLVDVDLAPAVLTNTDNTLLVLLSRSTYKSIATLSPEGTQNCWIAGRPPTFYWKSDNLLQ